MSGRHHVVSQLTFIKLIVSHFPVKSNFGRKGFTLEDFPHHDDDVDEQQATDAIIAIAYMPIFKLH